MCLHFSAASFESIFAQNDFTDAESCPCIRYQNEIGSVAQSESMKEKVAYSHFSATFSSKHSIKSERCLHSGRPQPDPTGSNLCLQRRHGSFVQPVTSQPPLLLATRTIPYLSCCSVITSSETTSSQEILRVCVSLLSRLFLQCCPISACGRNGWCFRCRRETVLNLICHFAFTYLVTHLLSSNVFRFGYDS